MKKQVVILTLAFAFIFTSCGSTAEVNNNAESKTIEESSGESENKSISSLEALGDIKVDENIFSVDLTIPADYAGDITQEELDEKVKELGYKSATLNTDGSVTYLMTKEQHKDMLQEIGTSINKSLTDMIGSENYPNITNIKANENFTEFTVTTKSNELDMAESFSTLGFYTFGGMYNIFSGEKIDNIHVDFINVESGEIIASENSSDVAE